jgi:hypothetical protein
MEGRNMVRTKSYVFHAVALGVVAVVLLSGCSVDVQKEKNGSDKKVDIRSPLGGIHVSNEVDPNDVGLAVYPGARLKPNDGNGDNKSANVNISGFGYGVRVVALEYESDDPPAKLIAFYQDQLRKYGHVLVCHTTHLNVNTDLKDSDRSSHELTCEGDGSNIELKVGSKENQHIVAVEPDGKGSSFSLVYVRTHGKEADI